MEWRSRNADQCSPVQWTGNRSSIRELGQVGSFSRVILQPLCRINAIEAGSADQVLNGRRPFPGAFAAGKEPVLFPDGNRTNRVLDGVIVDRQMSGSRSYREDATVDALSYNVLLCLGNVP